MSREMNNLIKKMIKYDLIGGFISVLIILLVFKLKYSLIFSLGLIVALINAIISGIVIERLLIKGKGALYALSFIIKIGIILIIAFPFYNDFKEILSYILGYISHFLFLVISAFDKKWKEDD